MRAKLWCLATLALSAAGVLILSAAAPATIADLRGAFERPPNDSRPMMRWWWFGPAVTTPELQREMRAMKDGGIGGFEVQPVYPLALDDPATGLRNLPYLSDEFLAALRFTADQAHDLGLRMDLTLGSGWPFGGPHIPLAQAAGRLRLERLPIPAPGEPPPSPTLAAGESLVASFPERGMYFIASHTGMKVKRAAAGAEGFVLDHYDRAAIDNHLKNVGDRLFSAFGKNLPYAIFSDSLEVERSDWTGNLLDEFRKRRGYDLKPNLPALAGDFGPNTAAIRHDWALTLSELAGDNYLAPLRDWAHRHGTLFRSQTYGRPPVVLWSNVLDDLSEGEGYQFRQFSNSRWAASANHLLGRPVTSAETWTWLHTPAFRAAPLDMKAEADIDFLQGINQFVGHGWAYSPASAGEPGWRFYAAAVFNDHNPWWPVMPDVMAYLQRVSFLLRQGAPANDVAVYLPNDDAFASFTLGTDSVNRMMDQLIGPRIIPSVLDAGYNLDFIDDGAIAHGGVPYPILILPGVERIPLATYRKLEEYVRKGGILIATRRTPSLAPGLMQQGDAPAIAELSRTLFDAGARARFLADEAQLGATLHQALPADVATAPEIGFIHRKLPFAEIYFLANTSNHPVHSSAAFRIKGLDPAWWNPYDGSVAKAAAPGPARLDLDLAPYESRVVVFSKERVPERRQPSGAAPAPIEISSAWQVTFPGSAPASMAKLHSWTDDPATANFSGQVTYETSVTLPSAALSGGHPMYLNFGEGTPITSQERTEGPGMKAMLDAPVREAAVVYVNGKRAGAVWHPPYEVEVTPFLHAGANLLRVVVANTAINEMAKGPLPDYTALKAKYGDRFQPQDMRNLRPIPSGLLGPIRLIAR